MWFEYTPQAKQSSYVKSGECSFSSRQVCLRASSLFPCLCRGGILVGGCSLWAVPLWPRVNSQKHLDTCAIQRLDTAVDRHHPALLLRVAACMSFFASGPEFFSLQHAGKGHQEHHDFLLCSLVLEHALGVMIMG